jgi:hypothetical protein
MSLVQECALVEEAIQRARSLVSPHASLPPDGALGDVGAAARSTAMTTATTGDSSGAFIAAHRGFAARNAVSLAVAGRTDHELRTQMAAAAALTQTGAQRLDAIAGQTRVTRQAAAATSPTAQRVILSALRSQLSRATEVLYAISGQSGRLGGHVQALDYVFASAPRLLEQPLPEGPVVWCLRPNGTFGRYRCSILYPDLRVSTYWSSTDDTHG